MNGVKPRIEIFKPFGEAFELANKILFQPFDLKKWFVIGFAAFLSGHLAGVGLNIPSPFGNWQSHRTTQGVVPIHFEQWKPWMVAAVVVFALLFFGLVIVLTWLKARGNFIFTHCIVRNQAAIAEPWREYQKEGNSYFLFLLGVMFVVLALLGLIASFIWLEWFKQTLVETNPVTAIGLLVFLSVFWASIVAFVSVATYFMVPVMYRRRCRAVEAFRDVTLLIWHHLVSFILFCLFGIVLLFAVLMIGALVTCATCCLAALPYIGTVILLPLFVCLRAFGLLFLRQFGSEYDVWANVMPPEFLPVLSGEAPPPPSIASAPDLPPEPPSSPRV